MSWQGASRYNTCCLEGMLRVGSIVRRNTWRCIIYSVCQPFLRYRGSSTALDLCHEHIGGTMHAGADLRSILAETRHFTVLMG